MASPVPTDAPIGLSPPEPTGSRQAGPAGGVLTRQKTRLVDQSRRIRIGVTGLAGIVTAILVAGALVNRTAEDVMANMVANGTVPVVNEQEAATRNDPMSEIGAAPAAEPEVRVEAVPGTGAVVDPVTGNVSDLPAKPGSR